MPTLTATEQAKLLAYRQKQALSGHTSPTLTTTQTTQKDEIPDLISWCVEDIVGKLERVDYYQKKSETEKDNIKDNLHLEFLQNVLVVVKDIISKEEGYKSLLEAINQAGDIEEMARIIGLGLLIDENLQHSYYSAISLFYVKKAILLGVEVDKDMYFE
jgi:hypothetical protein